MKTTIEDVSESIKGSRSADTDLQQVGDQKSKNLNEVVQRMLKVKQLELEKNTENHQKESEIRNENNNSNNMIDVQFATASKHTIPERCFGELEGNSADQLSSIIKSERGEGVNTNEISPFIPSSVLDRQTQNGDVKSNASASPAQSPSSHKDEEADISHSPTDLRTTFSQATTLNPSHPSICSLTPNQFMDMTSSIIGAKSPIGSSLLTAANGFPTYHQELLNRISAGKEEANKKITSPSTSSSHANNENGNSKGRMGRGNKNNEPPRNGDDSKPQYKRPPHTYPALIASAILDSPGNLITLRGIYDYIMSNFPYYKYCHDKSAWQNSIRHNLSLNQCFVKVPRYENAAKSNFWTMTQDGFEEFGNENSFKRRRRRGATLAPISAYKNKKYSSALEIDNSKNGKPKTTIAAPQNVEGAWPQSISDSNLYKRKNQVLEDLKRRSPNNDLEIGVAKHPRMMILKQGEGPKMYKSANDQLQRPNSLSSVEEMQGNVNSFTKSLSATESAKKKVPYLDQEDLAAYEARAAQQQQWFMAAAAAQKNLLAGLTSNAASMAAAGMLPYLVSSSPNHSPPSKMTSPHQENGTKEEHLSSEMEAPFERSFPVLMDGIEIGNRIVQGRRLSPSGMEHGGMEVISFQCRFCEYKYHGDDATSLKQHCQILHRQEIIRLKSLATTERVPERRHSPQQPSPLSWQPTTTTGPSDSVSSSTAATSIYSEPLLRSFAHHMAPSMEQMAPSFTTTSDVQKQQQLLAILQQAMMANAQGPVDPSRRQMLYQQMLMQNSMFQPQSQETSNPDQLPLPLVKYLKYQNLHEQEQRKTEQTENNHKNTVLPRLRNGSNSSSDERSAGDDRVTMEESDSPSLVHGWRKCGQCDFTAKGSHGLELHCRKVHGDRNSSSFQSASVLKTNSELPDSSTADQRDLPRYKDTVTRKISRDALSEPGYPLTNTIRTSSISTQTTNLRTDDRTCKHCDVTFGDEMMYALHMSCHDKSSPYTCTICGQNCQEKYYFNVHLLRGLHGNTQTDKQRNELANHDVAAIDNRE